MKRILSILFALVLVVSLGLVTAAPVAAQITVLDHFKCYQAWGMETIGPIGEVVYLEDQFGTVEAVVGEAKFFCNPVAKWDEEMPPSMLNWDHHLTLYSLDHEEEPQELIVQVENQFGTQQLVVSDPVLLGVPTWKLDPGEHSPPEGLDHFLLYEVTEGTPVNVVVGLEDQFFSENVLLYEPVYFANPVKKTHDGDVTLVGNPDEYLVCYRVQSGYMLSGEVWVSNQFDSGDETQYLEVYMDESYPALLAVPSEREEWVVQYTLTISSTAGGSVTTPGEATFTYDAGTVVSLVAAQDTGYGFVNWAGDVGTIANVNTPTTTITMQSNYNIIARFLPGVVAAKTQTVTGYGIVDAIDEADIEVVVNGTATVTIAKYATNPHPPTSTLASGGYGVPASLDLFALDTFSELNIFRDVSVEHTKPGTEIEIRLYYTDGEVVAAEIDEESLRLFWWNEPAWVQCSNSGVNTASNYIWAIITEETTPSLADLRGTEFGGYGHPSAPPGPCGCFIATAAYGTDRAKEIDILREFRDTILLPNSLGARFISLYYETSPPIANFVSQHEVLRTAVRVGFVDPIVKILDWTHDLWSARDS
jgi:hypothetical protein